MAQTSAQRLAVQGVKLSRRLFKYPDLCTFKRITESKGTAGGNIKTSTVTTANVPCYVKPVPVRNAESIVASAAESGSIYDITFPGSLSGTLVDVDSTCQAIISARGGDPARTLNVIEVERGSSLEVTVRASVTEP